MRALLVLNHRSRRGLREGTAVRHTLRHAGIDIQEGEPSPGEVDAVIAAGGDGTVLRAIPRALALGVPLGILPLGTFNELARTLRVPDDLAGACACIANQRTRTIDLGRVNGVYFVNEASIGISARIARRQTPQLKQRFGVLGVLSTIAQGLRQAAPFFVEITYDAQVERFRSVQLTIANSARFGGVIERSDAAIDDGWLDLYSVDMRNWLHALRVLRKILSRDPSQDENLRVRRSTRFHVRTHHPHRISADGEPAGTTPAAFEILPQALRVYV